eukprot:gene14680-biopygen638
MPPHQRACRVVRRVHTQLTALRSNEDGRERHRGPGTQVIEAARDDDADGELAAGDPAPLEHDVVVRGPCGRVRVEAALRAPAHTAKHTPQLRALPQQRACGGAGRLHAHLLQLGGIFGGSPWLGVCEGGRERHRGPGTQVIEPARDDDAGGGLAAREPAPLERDVVVRPPRGGIRVVQRAGQLDLAWRLPAARGPDCVPLRSLRKPFVIGEHLILAQQPALSRGTAPVFSRCVPVLPLPARAHAAKCAPELRKLAQQGTNGVVGRTRAHLLQLGGTLSTLRRALGGALRLRRRELGGRRG